MFLRKQSSFKDLTEHSATFLKQQFSIKRIQIESMNIQWYLKNKTTNYSSEKETLLIICRKGTFFQRYKQSSLKSTKLIKTQNENVCKKWFIIWGKVQKKLSFKFCRNCGTEIERANLYELFRPKKVSSKQCKKVTFLGKVYTSDTSHDWTSGNIQKKMWKSQLLHWRILFGKKSLIFVLIFKLRKTLIHFVSVSVTFAQCILDWKSLWMN